MNLLTKTQREYDKNQNCMNELKAEDFWWWWNTQKTHSASGYLVFNSNSEIVELVEVRQFGASFVKWIE